MPFQVNFLRIFCATGVGLALVAGASALPGGPQTQRAEELAKLVGELHAALDVANTDGGGRPSMVQSEEYTEKRPSEPGAQAAPEAQLVGQSAAAATRRASPAHNGSPRGNRAEEVANASNTGIIPSRSATAPTESRIASNVSSDESNDLRDSTTQAPRVPAGPRLPSVFYPRGSTYVRPGSSGASRSSTSSNTTNYSTPPTVVTSTPQQASHSSRPSAAYGRGAPTVTDIPSSTSSSNLSFIRDRLESLQQIKENLERLVEVVKLLALKVADESQAYAKACEAGNCQLLN